MHSLLIAALAAAAAATPMMGTSYSAYNPSATTATTTYTTLGNPTAVPNPVPSKGTIANLLTQDNRVARFKEIQKEVEEGNLALKFDFNPAANPNATVGLGGQVDLASRANFPILTDLGISAAGVFFNPCGLNTPHIHPDATEFFTLVTETSMLTGFVLENGLSTEFNTTLTQFQGTVFPQGSIHFQQNLDCKPAVGIAGLNSEDPGASSVAQNFLINIDPAIVDATLGFPKQIDASNFAQFKANIPVSIAKGVEECLKRCNIAY